MCSEGQCITGRCPGSTTDCNGGCIDLTTDWWNCGSCSHVCATGEDCRDGTCLVLCPEGLSDCSGTCLDLTSAPLNCGVCDHVCARNQVCQEGVCAEGCAAGYQDCSGACVSLATNRLHCGTCGNGYTEQQVCVDGGCVILCEAGLTDCGGSCAYLMEDESNCGEGSHVCGAGARCIDGECIVRVAGAALNPTTLNLGVGESEQLVATVMPVNATDQSVIWTSSAPAVANVDDDGLVTALGAGNTVIRVTTVDGGFTATCQVTVTVRVDSVSVTPTTLSLLPGETASLTATIAPSNATNKNVTWSSSDLNVATVTNTGMVSANNPGTTTITVTTVDGNKQAYCEVTVGSTAVTGLTITPPAIIIIKGQSIQLQVTLEPKDATDKRVLWSSSDGNVVGANQDGVITGLAGGQATVTTTTLSGGKTDTCAVTVRVPVTGVTVEPESLVIPPGGTGQLTATITPEDATNKQVTWQSADESIATVDNNGIVSGNQAGFVQIIVTTSEGNYAASSSIQVTSCIDHDGDSYGEGEDCLGPDCDDNNPYAWTGATEVCDGIDNNCNGLIDAGDPAYEEQYCTLQVGVCNGSTKECPMTLRTDSCYSENDALGILKSCEVPCNAERYAAHNGHYVNPETLAHCDGKDNDCDSEIDELCVCSEGETEDCGADIGECELGYRKCVRGDWSDECFDSVNQGTEICDGKDNDCDGEVDEEAVCGPCNWNEVMVDRPSDNAKFCIDRYEASRRDATAESEGVSTNMLIETRPGVKPWSNVTFQTAQQICTNRGMELCSAEVWIAACRTGQAQTICTPTAGTIRKVSVMGAAVTEGPSLPGRWPGVLPAGLPEVAMMTPAISLT